MSPATFPAPAAQLISTHNSEVVHAAKVEIGADAVRVIYLRPIATLGSPAPNPIIKAHFDRLSMAKQPAAPALAYQLPGRLE